MDRDPAGRCRGRVRQPQFPYNSAAQGKVALAFATDRQRAVWTRLISEKRTSETVLDHTVLWEQVAAVRKRGWSSAPEETFRGVNAVAAPVFGTGGEVAYTLALVGSIHFLPDPPPPEQVDALVRTAVGSRASSAIRGGTEPASRSSRSTSTPRSSTARGRHATCPATGAEPRRSTPTDSATGR
ncbi:IclR family transcriptional regulator domain-containing protein [Pseudonocardia sp. T1-2H]|uniref:IclR family transcriptional regulator domain-containing protein n=1 Tax=Pseudonocardia sp. T1-2H TaxID=3128899 RepID=UPI00310167B1